MSDPFLGEIRLVGFSYAPRNWAFCNGQLLSIPQNTALFSLLGTTYGGNGTTTFALPDLQGRVPVGPGTGPGLSPYVLGQVGGVENVTLNIQQMPSHTHALMSSNQAANVPLGGAAYLPGNSGRGAAALYTSNQGSLQTMSQLSIGSNGANQAHTNLQPYLGLNYIIALAGIFPTRS